MVPRILLEVVSLQNIVIFSAITRDAIFCIVYWLFVYALVKMDLSQIALWMHTTSCNGARDEPNLTKAVMKRHSPGRSPTRQHPAYMYSAYGLSIPAYGIQAMWSEWSQGLWYWKQGLLGFYWNHGHGP